MKEEKGATVILSEFVVEWLTGLQQWKCVSSCTGWDGGRIPLEIENKDGQAVSASRLMRLLCVWKE